MIDKKYVLNKTEISHITTGYNDITDIIACKHPLVNSDTNS